MASTKFRNLSNTLFQNYQFVLILDFSSNYSKKVAFFASKIFFSNLSS